MDGSHSQTEINISGRGPSWEGNWNQKLDMFRVGKRDGICGEMHLDAVSIKRIGTGASSAGTAAARQPLMVEAPD